MLVARAQRFWQDLTGHPAPMERTDEFPDELPVGPDARSDKGAEVGRRGFFALMGLSTAALSAACSRSPVGKIVPYLQKPDEVTPGVSAYYASTCGACSASCGILLKTRDGRPIKVEGNDLHPLTGGATCAVGQAAVLSLYDAARAKGPSSGSGDVTWAGLDQEVMAALERIKAARKGVRVIAPPEIGPTASAALDRFLAGFPDAKRVSHEPPDIAALADAHHATHGVRAVPAYHLDKATFILGVGADFLGTWLSPVAFTRAYRRGRDLASGTMSRHVQLEGKVSLTGSVADERLTTAPSDTVPVLAAIARALLGGEAAPELAPLRAALAKIRAPELRGEAVSRLAQELVEAKGHGVVLCGSDDPAAQMLSNLINERIGAYRDIIDLRGGTVRPEGALRLDDLIGELTRGAVGALFFWNVNPVYDDPRGGALAGLLSKVDLTVSTAGRRDETASLVQYLAPDHDALESWGDVEQARDLVGLRQPAVAPLFDTRSACESFLRWAGAPEAHDDLLRARWQKEVHSLAITDAPSFQAFWDRSLQDGFARINAPALPVEPRFSADALAQALSSHPATRPPGEGLELLLYEKVGLRDGRLGNNGWLHELPDPISKVTWSNYACLSPALARQLGARDGSLVTVESAGRSITLPAVIEPGVHPRVVAVALGYGRTHAGTIGNNVGAHAAPLGLDDGRATRAPRGARVKLAGGSQELARSQTHASQEGRPLVKEASLAEHRADKAAGNEPEGDGKHHLSMWSGHAYPGHKWGMSVDLSACTGCSACVVACQAENNIPVVGEVEVRRRREMHWIRIDRYFAGSEENPSVVHQPMMCQHCDNAPCETVCPVLATVHSEEGLNQQVYNRCVGTRYCANNCPPKVRRFNWFDYPHDDPLERMVLNPDVAVRSRGVMEKCSMCVQRIQEGKARARAAGRPLADGEIKTACEQVCPAGAIVFGDLNDPASRVAAEGKDPRSYHLLDEIGTRPSVSYLTRIRNAEKTENEGHHG
ncbi:MAG: 4Fe-4S dicluster domain-containing protein [Byssovorax sp.]